jgi:hypothetical protein
MGTNTEPEWRIDNEIQTGSLSCGKYTTKKKKKSFLPQLFLFRDGERRERL